MPLHSNSYYALQISTEKFSFHFTRYTYTDTYSQTHGVHNIANWIFILLSGKFYSRVGTVSVCFYFVCFTLSLSLPYIIAILFNSFYTSFNKGICLCEHLIYFCVIADIVQIVYVCIFIIASTNIAILYVY